MRDCTAVFVLFVLTVSFYIENPAAQQLSNRIVPIGKLLLNANLGLDNTPGTVFLLKDSRLPDGVMFAISAYYRSHKPVRVQVWRPTNTTSVYKLVWEHRFESPVVGVRQDIYFYAANETLCYHFRRDDRVGVFLEEVPAAIPYAFNRNTRTVFSRPPNVSIPFQIGSEANFDKLHFPFDFSVEAYVDTVNGDHLNDTRDWVPCPQSTIPDDSPTHGATGHTGATGPVGSTGSTGPKGDRGPPGPAGPSGALGNSANAPSSGTNVVDIVSLVWLCLLTIAVIIIFVIIVFFLVARRRRNVDDGLDTEATSRVDHDVVSRKRSMSPSIRDDVIWSDLKEETESMYSVHTMKETTPLSKTGPFVYDGPFAASNDSAIVDRQAPTDDIATLDVSSPADQY